MAITLSKFKETNKVLEGEQVVELINKALSTAEKDGHYSAISAIVAKHLAVLVSYLEIDGYITRKNLVWALINAYNE